MRSTARPLPGRCFSFISFCDGLGTPRPHRRAVRFLLGKSHLREQLTKSRPISVILLMCTVTQNGRGVLREYLQAARDQNGETERFFFVVLWPWRFTLDVATIGADCRLPCVLVGSRPLCRSGWARPVKEDPGRVPY